VQAIFQQLYDQGEIYKGEYDWMVHARRAKRLAGQAARGRMLPRLADAPSSACGEESYFFKLSKYADQLMRYIEDHPEFIQPVSRKNEMINKFLLPGLEDWPCPARVSTGHPRAL
jgi:methionyl-tRNA synthetase